MVNIHANTHDKVKFVEGKVNWTEYFHLISPSDVIPHIQPDLETVTPSKDTLKEIELLLQNTTGRAITNYVMLVYAMSWVEHLDEKYRNIAKGYIEGVKPGPPSSAREASCALATWTNYNHVMMAMHARQNQGRVGRHFKLSQFSFTEWSAD
ncbi:hypothetical protein Y032_1282g3806 [Ancylostoma ceylanicum]|uniref:Uncharacterized protein n=3 Tax=Ancylostoma ceylanicum TaxID=53326 RepID=A0A016W4Y4_9BILA|nr:hypothetical protein Y032_1282g3806 [Ancylostoma ceylanicum]